MPQLLRYLLRFRRAFICSALLGVAVTLSILPRFLRWPLVHNADWYDGVAFVLGVVVLLFFSSERFLEFLRRYRRSAAIPLTRPQRADLIAVFMTATLLSLTTKRLQEGQVPGQVETAFPAYIRT